MNQNANVKNDQRGLSWACCWQCNHKLLRIVSAGHTELEIKCPSCKAMNELRFNAKSDNHLTAAPPMLDRSCG